MPYHPSSSCSMPTSVPGAIAAITSQPGFSQPSKRYFDVPSENLLDVGDTSIYLMGALEDIINNFPPRSRYPHEALQGLWSGPTGIAYLLVQVSSRSPDLVVSGQPAIHWAQCYIAGSRGHNLRLGSHGCGVSDERLAFEAVKAALTKDLRHVRDFVAMVEQVAAVEEFPDENLYGRAGTLYLLRMIKHWVGAESCGKIIDPAIAEIANTVMNHGLPEPQGDGNNPRAEGRVRWKWHGQRYLGAVHGDIGIIMQLVLSMPSLADRLEGVLERLLRMQQHDGNWPSSEGRTSPGKGLVQFCHGAPGFVVSLCSIRQYFPRLQGKIDGALQRARQCIWTQGLLKKEPNICHGIFGNALCLPKGPQRQHFLAIATPENVGHMKASDPTGTVFERADYGRSYSSLTSYAPCAVWTWLVAREPDPIIMGYNDV
ncbi:hypothetical protein QBC40DRAFT_46151 [Triangularia verruculosa]|uniref:Uncharacterized protein n=1 Tax=Triangularia verruculosa TaxID=2587418 RepID=A0AAN6XJY5_9PEZI|nr:hypothetical protein QBC40DRAFT_46151 [Triangularia verruculosa]